MTGNRVYQLCSRLTARVGLWLLLALSVCLAGCGEEQSDTTPDGRVVVRYWEKWTGFEADAMRAVVDDYNASQTDVFVKMLSVSGVDQKLLLATAGGNPPDVAGLWTHRINVFAEKGALTPLDGYAREAGVNEADYIPAFWELCRYRGYLWALPSTPASIGLFWNKRLFEEAGLDPDVAPRTMAELDAMAERLTIVEIERGGETVRVRFPDLTDQEREAKDFEIVQLGFSPKIPGWYGELFGYWFGGELWDGETQITTSSGENVAAYEWFGGYARRYGRSNLDKFGASFGNTSSPQDAFLSGQVAMVQQGVWMYNFIDRFSPNMRWGASALPASVEHNDGPVALIESDVLVVPRGAKHPDEAFEFIRYVNSRGPMEKLTLGHRKFSPLSKVSDNFIARHPNPAIQVFMDLAASPNAFCVPRTPIWTEYSKEMLVATDRVYAGDVTVERALSDAQARMQMRLDRVLNRWELVEERRLAEWGGRSQ